MKCNVGKMKINCIYSGTIKMGLSLDRYRLAGGSNEENQV